MVSYNQCRVISRKARLLITEKAKRFAKTGATSFLLYLTHLTEHLNCLLCFFSSHSFTDLFTIRYSICLLKSDAKTAFISFYQEEAIYITKKKGLEKKTCVRSEESGSSSLCNRNKRKHSAL